MEWRRPLQGPLARYQAWGAILYGPGRAGIGEGGRAEARRRAAGQAFQQASGAPVARGGPAASRPRRAARGEDPQERGVRGGGSGVRESPTWVRAYAGGGGGNGHLPTPSFPEDGWPGAGEAWRPGARS